MGIQSANAFSWSEKGSPFLTHFNPKDYNSLRENWAITQDNRGVLYFGNESNILEYDGNSWRKIRVPNAASVRSLYTADDGTIYVCAFGDFGYLKPDSAGQLTYHSLKPFLDKKYQKYGEMWDVVASSKGVFFKTGDEIFKWDGRRITVIDSAFAFRLYKIDDTVYTRSQDDGLLEIDNDMLKLMPDGAYFSDTGVYNMLPFKAQFAGDKDGILVTTNFKGLFLHDGKKFFPFKTEVDSFLFTNQVYNACRLANGNFALATQRGGVVILDTRGRLVRFINEDNGLPTNVIYNIFADRQGGLWLATNNGIVYCETPSPLTLFQNSGVLKDITFSVRRFKDTLYVANDFGVSYYSKRTTAFELVKGSNKPAYELLDFNEALLAGTNWGLAVVKHKVLQPFLLDYQTQNLVVSKVFPGRIYAGTSDGLFVIQKQINGGFTIADSFETDGEIYSVVEEKDGALWLEGHFLGIYHITGNMQKLSRGKNRKIAFQYFDKQNKLPGNKWKIFEIRGKLLLSTDKGSFVFNERTERFRPDSTLGHNLAGPQNALSLIEQSTDGNLWILAAQGGEEKLGKAYLQKDGRYIWKPDPIFRRIALKNTRALYSDIDPLSKKEILWISTSEGLVRYYPESTKNIRSDYVTLIRKVSVHGDSVIFRGMFTAQTRTRKTILPFSKNDIRFEFSAISFDKTEETLYQYLLEGNDEEWSAWSHEPKKGYTNLSAGSYTFRVRSKNVYGIVGKEDSFHFTILPPFYLTWWAYLSYALIFSLGIFAIDRFQRKKLIRRERTRARRREEELVLKQATELETIDNIVRVINRELVLDNLLKVLLEQGMKLFPQSENGAVLIYDQQSDDFKFAATIGYNADAIKEIRFTTDEISGKYAQGADEVEKGVFIVKRFRNTENVTKFNILPKPKSLILMSATWNGMLEGIVVFANLSKTEAFDRSDARRLRSFREHTISAIAKARILKELQQKNDKIIKTQQQLITQEKLASLGQLTAGIAHEIKNPLNFVKISLRFP